MEGRDRLVRPARKPSSTSSGSTNTAFGPRSNRTSDGGLLRRRFRWKNGQVVVELPDDEQDMLRHVLPQLRELAMGETDPALRRLSPPARPDDPDAEAFYRQMVTDERASRLEAIEVVEEGIGGTVLDDAGVDSWMHSLNALRLVLGERLDVDDRPRRPSRPGTRHTGADRGPVRVARLALNSWSTLR